MPELPEVETVVRGLRPQLVGRQALDAWIGWPKVLDGLGLAEFNGLVSGQRLHAIHRRGKYICIALDRGFLTVHLRMTGRLYLSPNPRGDDAWVRFTLALDDGRFLAFSDARKFGRVLYSDTLDFLEAKLGPEPLTLKPADFKRLLRGSSRQIKVFLLDQKRLAGVGNIYADEALFQARINPRRPVDQLSDRERLRLGRAIQEALTRAIDYEGASINWYRKPDGTQGESQKHFQVYGRKEEPCLRCGRPIRKIVLGQRGTHFCPKCQA